MEEYSPIDTNLKGLAKSAQNAKSERKGKYLTSFKIHFDYKDSMYLLVILIQFFLIYRINHRLLMIEGLFDKQLKAYQKKLEENEEKIKKLEERQGARLFNY